MIRYHRSETHRFSIFDHLSPKTKSDVDQIDVMAVSRRHAREHLEGQSILIRTDRNDWDRLPKHGIKIMFWAHHSAIHKCSIFGRFSSKTESDTDQIDVM